MIELTLPDMTCGHCKRKVEQTVQRIDAQAQCEVDLTAHRVRIQSDQPPERFTLALAEQGYPANLVGGT